MRLCCVFRWANQGLEFLLVACEPRVLATLTEIEFIVCDTFHFFLAVSAALFVRCDVTFRLVASVGGNGAECARAHIN